MLRIRLSRVGKKGHPSYRIVVADVAAPRDGKYLEWIGNYDPMADPPLINIKEDRATHWLNLGAQPSDPVLRILDKNGILERSPKFRAAAATAVVETTAGSTPAVVADEPESEPPTSDPELEASVDGDLAHENEPEPPEEDS